MRWAAIPSDFLRIAKALYPHAEAHNNLSHEAARNLAQSGSLLIVAFPMAEENIDAVLSSPDGKRNGGGRDRDCGFDGVQKLL